MQVQFYKPDFNWIVYKLTYTADDFFWDQFRRLNMMRQPNKSMHNWKEAARGKHSQVSFLTVTEYVQ